MSKAGIYISILLILIVESACTRGGVSGLMNRFVSAPDKAQPHMSLGTVFNANKDAFDPRARHCIIGDPVFIPNRSMQLTSESEYSIDDVFHEINSSAFIRFNYFPGVQVEGGLTNRMRLTSNSSKAVIFHDMIFNLGSIVYTNLRIDQEYYDSLTPDERKAKCGHGAVTRVQLGAKATIGMEFLLNSKGLSNYLKAIVTGRLMFIPGAEISITLADGYLAQIDDVHVVARVFADQYGGNQMRFNNGARADLGPCEIHITAATSKDFATNASFKQCLHRFDEVTKYFRTCFQNNLSLDPKARVPGECAAPEIGKDEDADKLKEDRVLIGDNAYLSGLLSEKSNFAPLSYTVASYEDLGLFSLAQKVDPRPEDLEKRRIRDELLKSYLKLGSIRLHLEGMQASSNPVVFLKGKVDLKETDNLAELTTAIADVEGIIQDKKDAERGALQVCTQGSLVDCQNMQASFNQELKALLLKSEFIKKQYQTI